MTLASISCIFKAFIEGAIIFVRGAVMFIRGAVMLIEGAMMFIGGAVMLVEGAVTFVGGAVMFIGSAVGGRSFEAAGVGVVDDIKGVVLVGCIVDVPMVVGKSLVGHLAGLFSCKSSNSIFTTFMP